MTIEWKDKIALVTGANRGIGLALVKSLIRNGTQAIYMAGRDIDHLQELTSELKNTQTMLHPIQLDVTCETDIRDLKGRIRQLDILINNAGIATASGFLNLTADETALREMATNYFGPVNLTRALLPVLTQSPQGAIVNVSSIAGLANMPLLGPYSASKAALHSFTQSLRAELAKTQLLVQGVYPGPVDTRMTEGFDLPKATPDEVAQRILNAIDACQEDVFPDAMSENWHQVYRSNPKQLEKDFAACLNN
jgi:short-subunit dehydrogenase